MLKTGYAYLFYFFYNYVNSFKNNILVQFKAEFMIFIMEILLLASIFYYSAAFHFFILPEDFSNYEGMIFISPLIVLKFWFFERNEKWKNYLSEFKDWPEEKQKKWNFAMRLIIFLIFANFICSFYFLGTADFSQYRKHLP